MLLLMFHLACQGTQPEVPPRIPLYSPLTALTPGEYNHSILELFGLSEDVSEWPELPNEWSNDKPIWPWPFAPEQGLVGFDGMAEGQVLSLFQVESNQQAANHYAPYALVTAPLNTCQLTSATDASSENSCETKALVNFAQRAWRRPLSQNEMERLVQAWQSNLEAASMNAAVVLSISSILQSPAFLYRIEYGDHSRTKNGGAPLTSWEMASRLSYFLWDSMPDNELFRAAENDELRTPEQVREQAERMLFDSRSRKMLHHFHHQWLGTDDIHSIRPARRAYGELFGIDPIEDPSTADDRVWPDILIQTRQSMKLETELFVERTILDGDGTLKSLLTDNHGYYSDLTAVLYGDDLEPINGPSVIWQGQAIEGDVFGDLSFSLELHPATYPKSQRSGVLTLPSVLAVHANSVHPNPVARGVHVLEKMGCQVVGQPPPEAESFAPPDTLDAAATNRERLENATSPDQCYACHAIINPPGFAFEHYDSLGKWRDQDNGYPVDSSGYFTLAGGEIIEFTNAVDMTEQLANSRRVHDCYAKTWLNVATGVLQNEEDVDLRIIQELFYRNSKITDLLVSITVSDGFRYKRTEP